MQYMKRLELFIKKNKCLIEIHSLIRCFTSTYKYFSVFLTLVNATKFVSYFKDCIHNETIL